MKFPAIRESNGGGGGNGASFVKVKDGESVQMLLRGEPVHYHALWNGAGWAAVPQGTKSPEGKKAAFRFRIAALVQESGVWVAKILEQGYGVYEQLAVLGEDYDLERHVIKLSRKGSGPNDTTYTVIPLPKGAIQPDLEAKLKLIPLPEILVPMKDTEKKDEPLKGATVDGTFEAIDDPNELPNF